MQQPPTARRDPVTREHHGDRFEDPYAWMADRDSPELRELLLGENAWATARTEHLRPLAEQVFEEFRSRIEETDLSVPVRHDRWWYYSRTVEGEQYAVEARVALADHPGRPVLDGGRPPAGEQVLLDQNEEGRGHEFFAVGASEVSPAGDLLAYAVDLVGDERYDVRVRRVDDAALLDDVVRGTGGSLAWSLDGRHLFYTRVDEAWRPHQVWRHEVGAPADSDVLVHDETDERFFVGVGSSRDDRLVIIAIGSKTTSEFRLLDADDPLGTPRVVAERRQGVEYDIEPFGDQLLVTHNAHRVNFELAVAPSSCRSADDWVPFGVTARTSTSRVQRDSTTSSRCRCDVRAAPACGSCCATPTRRTVWVRPTTSPSASRSARCTSASTPRRRPRPCRSSTSHSSRRARSRTTTCARAPSRCSSSSTCAVTSTSRSTASAASGPRPPTARVSRSRSCTVTTSPPTARPPRCSTPTAPTASRATPGSPCCVSHCSTAGWVFAIAHVRGGSEMGRSWYDDGKLEAKPNTFTDFVACADHLVGSGIVAPDRLAAEGGSAGGLLMGAVVNQAPDRFRFVHAQVPFVDALTTVLDPSLPLTVVEWEEWGNPLDDPAAYALMKSYAPYENVRPSPPSEPARHGGPRRHPRLRHRAGQVGRGTAARRPRGRRAGPDPLPHRDGRRTRRTVRSLRPVAPVGVGDGRAHRPDVVSRVRQTRTRVRCSWRPGCSARGRRSRRRRPAAPPWRRSSGRRRP